MLISTQCIRIIITDDYNWEDSENLFLNNYNLLKEQQNKNNSLLNGKNAQIISNQKTTIIENIIETLPIKIRIDQQ